MIESLNFVNSLIQVYLGTVTLCLAFFTVHTIREAFRHD